MVRLLRSPRAIRSISIGVFVLACAWPAHAQEPPPDVQAPAHISLVDGVAVLERDGQVEDSPLSMPLLAGDRIRTRSGRVEVLFADGSTLHLDHNTIVDLQSDELLRLIEGRIRLSIPGPERAVSYRIDGPHGWAQISEPGDYRVALMHNAGGGELELAVMRGRAELANEGGQTPLRAGERAFVRAGAAPSYAYVANSAAMDAFDRWSERRRDERMSASAEYLPSEVRPYAASFERYGYWRDEPSYGRVWYPRVAVDWRPYYRGRWVSLRPYGWTWIAHDPWGWPTHHYGRWGISTSGSWFWIPGRSWGAAWVSWAYAPDYVSWCPLGFNNRPIFQININVGNRYYDPWRAWTVVPRRHFGFGYVHRNVIRASHLDRRTLSAFAHRDRAPEIIGHAVPRASAPIRVAGTASSRRGAAPLYTNLPANRGRVQADGSRIRVPNATRAAPADRETIDGRRQRAVPSTPAVRSERPSGSDDRRAAGARPNGNARRIETPNSDTRRADAPTPNRRVEAPGVRRRLDAPSAAAPQESPSRSPRSGSAVPRGEGAPNRRAVRPSDPRTEPAPERRRSASPRVTSAAPPAAPPSRVETPSYRRSAQPPQQGPPSDRPSRSYEARPRAVPRGDGGRPSGGARQAAPSRGPDRAPSGSIERRSPARAQPSARPSGGGSGGAARSQAGPPRGARPRSGGGGQK